jgi:methylthioribulose-1-phosphate dehydratase
MRMSSDVSSEIAAQLIEIGRRFDERGWVLGTSGNFSVVASRQPLELAITASSVHKGRLQASDVLLCDERGSALGGADTGHHQSAAGQRSGRPSAETLLHLEIARRRQAGAVLHTHSVWTTVLSDVHGHAGGFSIEGYEMLKGLHGVSSHEHREWIPIVDNDQDMPRLAQRVAALLEQQPDIHAFVLRRHGLYTWGDTLGEAERHIEILEFLFQTAGLHLQLKTRNERHGQEQNQQRSTG